MSVTVDTTTEPVHLVWTTGDTSGQTFRCLDGDQPWDLTNIGLRSSARNSLKQTIALTVAVTDPLTGEFTLTGQLDPDTYDYDVQFDHGNSAVATYIHGRIQVRQDVTQ